MSQNKTLLLTAEIVPYKDKVTGEPKSFVRFTVDLNGLKLQMKPNDRTAQALLEQYFVNAE